LSAALNSLSSSSIVDFYLRRNPEASERQRMRVSRAATVVWGLILFALAILSRRGGRVVEVGLSIASVAYGALLGVFLLGLLTRRANQSGAMVGMAAGFATTLYLWLRTIVPLPWPAGMPNVPWTWYVAIGCTVTFLIGYAASTVFGDTSAKADEHHA